MKPVDAKLRTSLFVSEPEKRPAAPEVQISLSVEPSRVRVPGRARVLVRVLSGGRPLDGFNVSISSSRGVLSSSRGSTNAGVVAADIEGQPEDVGTALVRVHSDLWEAQAVLSAGLEFVR